MVLISGPGTPRPCALQVSQALESPSPRTWDTASVRNGVMISQKHALSKELSAPPAQGVHLRRIFKMQIAHLRRRLPTGLL